MKKLTTVQKWALVNATTERDVYQLIGNSSNELYLENVGKIFEYNDIKEVVEKILEFTDNYDDTIIDDKEFIELQELVSVLNDIAIKNKLPNNGTTYTLKENDNTICVGSLETIVNNCLKHIERRRGRFAQLKLYINRVNGDLTEVNIGEDILDTCEELLKRYGK